MKILKSLLVVAVTTVAMAPVDAADAPTIAELFRKVDGAVVEIATVQQVAADQGPARRVSSGALGSGFLISNDGEIVTASHVVQVADEVSVRFVDGSVVTARVVNSDPSADVALIKAASVPDGITPVVLGDSDTANVGDQVFVIGAPYGIAHSLTVGHVSARRTPSQLFGGFEQVEILQTDAAINQGNSGGPMFNMRGEAIGVVSHILSTSGGFQGVGFVITSNLARRVLLEDPTPWTGLDVVLVEGPMARALNIPQRAGILVEGVAAGSPASAIGLQAGSLKAQIGGQSFTLGGDVILAINGIIIGAPDFNSRIDEKNRSLADDDYFVLRVLREGNVIELKNDNHRNTGIKTLVSSENENQIGGVHEKDRSHGHRPVRHRRCGLICWRPLSDSLRHL
jgi:S1-C subfamily serine protease